MENKKMTNEFKEFCNNWECPHNKNGFCENVEAFSDCVENILESIRNIKEAENKRG